PFPIAENAGVLTAESEASKGDLLVLASSGLTSIQFSGKPIPPEKCVQDFARAAKSQAVSAAFAALVSEWKKTGATPGKKDILLLAARRKA
ncbi:MAG TPA: hypothetical protein VLO07_00155, partial [Thermoanaerobaculia bacterium]|nr:hypothetical protein [Thermoanaerobaculia bacterium]